jgi:hypothetical protein
MAIVKKLTNIPQKSNSGLISKVKQAVSQQANKPAATPMRTAPTPVPPTLLSRPQPVQRPAPLPPAVQRLAQQAQMQARSMQQQLPPGVVAPQRNGGWLSRVAQQIKDAVKKLPPAMTPPVSQPQQPMVPPAMMPPAMTPPVSQPQQPMVPPAMTPPTIGIDKRMPVINDQPIQPPAMTPPVESVPTDPVTGRQVTSEDYQKMMEKFFPPGTTPPVAMRTPPPLEGFYASDEYKSYKNPYEVPGEGGRPGYSMAPTMMTYDPVFGDVSLGGGPGGDLYIDYLMRTNQQFGAGLNEYDKSRMQLNPDYLSNYFGEMRGNQFDKQQQLNQMLQQYQQTQQQQPAVQAIATQPRIF